MMLHAHQHGTEQRRPKLDGGGQRRRGHLAARRHRPFAPHRQRLADAAKVHTRLNRRAQLTRSTDALN
jgi:hypothetical protein